MSESSNQRSSFEREKADWIPVHLRKDSSARVNDYFDSRIMEKENGEMIGFFRGYQLVGKTKEIPVDYEANLVAMMDNKVKKIKELNPLRIWDFDPVGLNNSMEFTDVIEFAEILSQ